MNKFYRAIIIAILIISVVSPVRSNASFEKSFASAGFELFSALGASVDTAMNIARSTYHGINSKTKNQISKLQTKTQNLFVIARQAKNHLMSAGHQMRRSLPDVRAGLPEQIFNKIKHFTANVTQGINELLSQKEELVFTHKQETRILASLSETKDATRESPKKDVRYAQNAENQPIKIIERIIVKEGSMQQVAGSRQNETTSLLPTTNYLLQDPRINSLITNVADLTSRVDEKGGSGNNGLSLTSLYNMISQSQRIKTLDDVKITNATIEGYAQSSFLSSYLPLTGGTLTGGLTGTTLTLSNSLTGTSLFLSSALNASSTTHFEGFARFAGALFLSAPLNASSTAHFTATSTFGNLIRIEGTGTSTILGRLSISATSTMAGYKICTQENNVCAGGAFSSSGGFTTLRTPTDLVGIGTSTPAEKLSVNGGAFFDSDIIRFGSSSAPTLNFRYFASSTSTIPNLTSAFTFATSTTNTPLLTLSTKSSRYGRVGIGTSSPSALFAINALNSSNQQDNLFYVGSSTANVLSVDSHGFVGIGTSSHSAFFSLYASSGGKRILSIGSSTNSFFIIDADGHVAIGTTTNTAELNVTGTINAKAYNVGGTKVLPNGFIAYYTGSCPTGWTEYTTARGRYVVGTPASGTGEATVGTALSNAEQRATGKHDHSISDPGHVHNIRTGGISGGSGNAVPDSNDQTGTGSTQILSNTTGITITATSSVNGTNAPYVQLTACKAPAGSDYAEYYPTRDPSLSAGELVALDLDNPGMIKRYGESHEVEPRKDILIGIVSTQPGYVIGNLFEKDGKDGIYQRPIALNGRALVRVSLENGSIFVGDRIAPSLIPGVGRKANQKDQMVGIALQPFNESLRAEGIEAIEVFIRFSSSDLDEGVAAIAAGSSTSDVSAATSDVFPPAWTIDQTTGRLSTTYGLDLGGNSIENVSKILSASGSWRIGEDGKLVVTEIQSEKLKVKSAVEFGSQEKPIGVTIYDKITGQPRCAFFADGIWTSESGKCGNVDENGGDLVE